MFESLKRTDSQESLVQECLYLLHIRQGRRKYFNIEEIAYITMFYQIKPHTKIGAKL